MIQFFTRIPIRLQLDVQTEDFSKGAKWLPFVGLIIGSALAGLDLLIAPRLSPFTTAILLVFAEVFLTGGLHLDGLSDSFDGLYSNRDKARILEIMKDSRLGANGALALLAFVMIKTALLMELPMGPGRTTILLAFPIFARWAIVIASAISPYAREKGMGNLFIGKLTSSTVIFASIFTALTMILEPALGVFYGVTVVFANLYCRHTKKIIGGMTGDTLGALIELTSVLLIGVGLALHLMGLI